MINYHARYELFKEVFYIFRILSDHVNCKFIQHSFLSILSTCLLRLLSNSIYRASKLTESTGTFILSHDHSEDNPVLERVVCPSLRHPAFANLIRSPKLLDVIEDLVSCCICRSM